jgi:hypothetical protein
VFDRTRVHTSVQLGVGASKTVGGIGALQDCGRGLATLAHHNHISEANPFAATIGGAPRTMATAATDIDSDNSDNAPPPEEVGGGGGGGGSSGGGDGSGGAGRVEAVLAELLAAVGNQSATATSSTGAGSQALGDAAAFQNAVRWLYSASLPSQTDANGEFVVTPYLRRAAVSSHFSSALVCPCCSSATVPNDVGVATIR